MADRTIRVSLVGDATSLIGAVNAARTALNQLGNTNVGTVRGQIEATGSAAEEAGKSASGFSDALKGGLAALGMEASFGTVVKGFRSVIDSGKDFQTSMNTLRTVTHANSDTMRDLEAQAIALGTAVELPGISAQDAAQGLMELAKGGLTAQQAITASTGTMQLATAANISGAQAAEINARALQAFRLPASEAGNIADALANAANAATGEITDMAAALQQSATVAQGMGATYKETTTVLALFAKNGVVGSDAGTSLKTMMTQLASPTREQSYALKDLNVNMFDQEGRFKGMDALAGQLSAAYKRLSTEQYNAAAATAFGTDALRAANIIGAEGVDGFNEMNDKVGLYKGAAIAAEAQTHGFVGAMNALVSNVESVSVSLYQSMEPALLAVADAGGKVVEFSKNMATGFGHLGGPVQRFLIAAVAVTLLRTPIVALGNAFVAMGVKAKSSFFTTAAGLVIVQQATGGVIGVAKAAGFAVMGLASGLKALFLSNPLGWILVLASTVIPMLFHNTDQATTAMVDFSQVIDGATGKLRENAIVALNTQDGVSDMTTRYTELGGAYGDWTMAVLGNTDAQDRAHGVMQAGMVKALQAGNAYTIYKQKTGSAALSIDDFATKVLASTDAMGYQDEGIRKVWNSNADLIRITDQANKAYGDGAKVAQESAKAEEGLNTLQKDHYATTQQMVDATKDLTKEYSTSTASAFHFKLAIDAVNAGQQAAAQAAQYLTAVLPGAAWREELKGARDAAAAYRGIGAAARDYGKAAQGVKDAEQALADTKNGSKSELKAIADAEKSVGKATESATDAQKAYGKAVKDSNESIASSKQAVMDAQAAAAKANKEATQGLADAQKAQAKDNADAAKGLVKVRADAAEKIKQTEKDVAKARATAIKDERKAAEDLAKVQLKAAEDIADAQKKYNDELKKSQASAIDLRVAQEQVVAARAKAADETIGAKGSAETAAFDTFAAAQDKLFALQKSGTATAYELAKAQKAVDLSLKNPNLAKDLASAMDDLAKAQKANADNTLGTAEARKKLDDTKKDSGTRVKDAKENLVETKDKGATSIADALAANAKAVQEANDSIASAQAKVAEAAIKGADAVAAAQQKIVETSASGAKAVADAQTQAAKAVESAAEQIAGAQKQVDDANQGVTDAQSALTEAQAAAIPTQAELAAAQWALADAQDAVWAAGDKQAEAFDKAGQAARDAAAGAFSEVFAKTGDMTAAAQAAGAMMQSQHDQFVRTATAAGYSADEAERMAKNQGLIPDKVEVEYSNLNEKAARDFVDEYNKKIDALDGKGVHWTAFGTTILTFDWKQVQDEFNRGARGQIDPSTGHRKAADDQTKDGGGGLAEGGFAGMVRGPGGPTDDKIKAWLSNGEFVVNARQTAKHAALLMDLNAGRNGFAAGGMAGKAAPSNMSPIVTATTVPVPDVDGVGKAWGEIGDKVDGTVKGKITPAIDKISESLMSSGKGHQTLLDNKVRPAWENIGKAVSDAQVNVLTPHMDRINSGSAGVGASMTNLLTGHVQPVWSAVGAKVSDTWSNAIAPNYGRINAGSSGVASTLGTAKGHMDASWSGIGATITGSYVNHIKPANDHIVGHTSAVAKFFTGVDAGAKKSAGTTTTNLSTINAEVKKFFDGINKLSPEAPPSPSAPAPASPSGPAPAAPAPRTSKGTTRMVADGGYITEGTGPRTDDVHLMASKGEYVINARSTAKHKDTLDRINYGGMYADGGLVTLAGQKDNVDKAGRLSAKRIEDATLGRAERAVEAGIDSLVARFSMAGGDGGSGIYPKATGARGKFLDAVMAQQGTHYVWGGAGPPPDFDCSGLMSWGLIQAGVGKGRLTAADFNHSFPHISVAKPGDMVTFDTGRIPGDAGHIGAVVDPSKGLMMHTDGAGPARISDYKSRDGGPLSIIDPIGGGYVPVAPPTPKPGQKAGDPPSAGWLGNIIKKIKSMTVNSTPFAGLQPDQSQNARAIAQVAINRGLGHNGVLIGEDVAFTESTLHNVAHGDAMGPSSTGLFQQMPPWGSYATRMNPSGSAGLFFDALLRLDPSWTSRSIPMAAQAVQQSEFSDGRNYAGNLGIANQITAALGYDSGGVLPMGPSMVYNGLSAPESVLTDRQWSLANSAMNYVINSTANSPAPVVTLNARVFVGGRELMDDVRVEVDNSFSALRTEISLQRRQDT